MANKKLFRSTVGKLAPRADSLNEAGGRAYQLSPKGALAQYAATGCLNGTYYASDALEEAMELATANVPAVDGKVYVCPDTSGSMSSPVTGHRRGGTSKVSCLDVAALVTAALLRKNPKAEVLPFAESVKAARLNPRDSVTTNAAALAALGGGGTNCGAPLAELNRRGARGDLVVYVSDNESWVDVRANRGTATMQEWERFKRRNPQAKLVNIDIQPYGTTQTAGSAGVLNVGGFSDQVFEVIAAFCRCGPDGDHWVRAIEEVQI